MEPKKLEHWELGYAIAVLDSINTGESIRKDQLFRKFSGDIIKWLVNKDLLCFKTINIGNFEEIRVALTERSGPFWCDIKSTAEKFGILSAINYETKQ